MLPIFQKLKSPRLPQIGSTILAGITLVSFLSRWLSLGDRLCHFRCYWGVLGLFLAIWSLFHRKTRWILLGLGLCVINMLPVAQRWSPGPPEPELSGPVVEVTVVSANLYANNRTPEKAVERLLEISPDVFIFEEVGNDWPPKLAAIAAKYPHFVNPLGSTALYSRLPLRLAQRTVFGDPQSGNNHLVEATVLVGNATGNGQATLRLVGIHSPTPRGAVRIARQRLDATEFAAALKRDPETTNQLLIGDFNTTPFSAVFDHIQQTIALRDTSQGRGYIPTWGPRLPMSPLLPWLGIPIDHAFVSDQVQVLERTIGEIPGSDHRYQKVKLRLRASY